MSNAIETLIKRNAIDIINLFAQKGDTKKVLVCQSMANWCGAFYFCYKGAVKTKMIETFKMLEMES